MRKIIDLRDNEVIHCPTEQEAKAILKLAHEAGYKWSSGKSFLDLFLWYWSENTCYNIKKGEAYYKKYYMKYYTITPSSEFLEDFVLPEKWYVKPDNLEEAKVLAKYFDENEIGVLTTYSNNLDVVLEVGLSNENFGLAQSDEHIQITFEQFQKYVLKQNMEQKQQEYKGELKGFPKEIVEKMLERQVEQGNPKNIEVFEKKLDANKYQGGFSWEKTQENGSFWYEILLTKDFDLFFEKYPKQNLNMENKINNLPKSWCVKNDGSQLFEDTVLKYLNNNYSVCYVGNSNNYYGVNKKGEVWCSYTNEKFNKELTLNEFIILIKMENKKIIGYRLIKPEYEEAVDKIIQNQTTCKAVQNSIGYFCLIINPISIKYLKKAGVLDLWFEPVYEQEKFQVGDWVVVEKPCSSSGNEKRLIDKITEITKGGFVDFGDCTIYKVGDYSYQYISDLRKATKEEIQKALAKPGNWVVTKGYSGNYDGKALKITEVYDNKYCHFEPNESRDHNFGIYQIEREATPEEIKEAGKLLIKLPQINGYSGKMEGDYIIYGSNCAKFHKQFFKDVYVWITSEYKGQNRTIKSVKLNSDVEITIEQITQVVEYIKYKENGNANNV